ncbi:MAG: hypothetical protein ACRC6K_05175 [Fusobacteriaceae bacterium]
MGIEIYVNNQKLNSRRKNFKTLGLAIKEINNILGKEKKIATNILINGEKFNENHLYNNEKCIIEVITKDHSAILLENLYKVEINGNRYFEIIEEIYYYSPEGLDLTELMAELLSIVSWYHNLISTLNNYILEEESRVEFEDYLSDFKKEYLALKKAFEQNDEDCVLDILEYDVAGLVSEFLKEKDKYIQVLLEQCYNCRLLS